MDIKSIFISFCFFPFMLFNGYGSAQPEKLLVNAIQITPGFETAGIIIETDEQNERPNIRYREKGTKNFQDGHYFVQYDTSHWATSLFDLLPGTEYEVKIGYGTAGFMTRKDKMEYTILRSISVSPGEDLQEKLDHLEPGDELVLEPGIYPAGLVIKKSGTPDLPIIIRGMISDKERHYPVEERKDLPQINPVTDNGKTPKSMNIGISITPGTSYVILDSIQIRNSGLIGLSINASHHITVQNCQIYDNDTAGTSKGVNLEIYGGLQNGGFHLIQDNHIADLNREKFYPSYKGIPDVVYYGIELEDKPGWNITIRRNRIEGHIDGIACSGDEDLAPLITEDLNDILLMVPSGEYDIYDNRIVNQADDAIETAYVKHVFSAAQIEWETHGFILRKMDLTPEYYPAMESAAIDNGLKIQGINNDYKGKGPDLGMMELY